MTNIRNQKYRIVLLGLISFVLIWTTAIQQVYARDDVVNAVLFYSPNCGHCQKVIQEDLPPLLDQYGAKINIIGINVTVQQGQDLYQSAVQKFKIPEDKLGVPCLIVGNTILVGSLEIPQQFPGIIESGLAQGGIPLPEIPGLEEALAGSEQSSQSSTDSGESQSSSQIPQASLTAEILAQAPQASSDNDPQEQSVVGADIETGLSADQPSLINRFNSDFAGNLTAVIVLIGMVGSVVSVGINYRKSTKPIGSTWPEWIIPVLAVLGLGIAIYLSYIEVTKTEAICGPVGNCNAVQQSSYASLFGVLPVGVLGALGYLWILALWLLQMYGPVNWRKSLSIILWGSALAGVLFSIYLTFLEPFVIGASCAWCLTSAVIITLIFLAASYPAAQAWQASSGRK